MITTLVCLATAIYFEARGEPMIGQIAVAQVVMNRVNDSRYPGDVCSVVKQGPTYTWAEHYPIRHRCQFSFYCDGKPETPTDKKAWQVSLKVAREVLDRKFLDFTHGATHYHATYVKPEWSETKHLTVRINDHVFYQWKESNHGTHD